MHDAAFVRGDHRLDVARVIIAIASGQAAAHVFDRPLGEYRDAVVAFLAVNGHLPARSLHLQAGEVLVRLGYLARPCAD